MDVIIHLGNFFAEFLLIGFRICELGFDHNDEKANHGGGVDK